MMLSDVSRPEEMRLRCGWRDKGPVRRVSSQRLNQRPLVGPCPVWTGPEQTHSCSSESALTELVSVASYFPLVANQDTETPETLTEVNSFPFLLLAFFFKTRRRLEMCITQQLLAFILNAGYMLLPPLPTTTTTTTPSL